MSVILLRIRYNNAFTIYHVINMKDRHNKQIFATINPILHYSNKCNSFAIVIFMTVNSYRPFPDTEAIDTLSLIISLQFSIFSLIK